MKLAAPRAWLPALAVLLLVSSALAPHLRAAADSGQQAGAWTYADCIPAGHSGGGYWIDVTPTMTITQPMVLFQNVAACSLSMIKPAYNFDQFTCKLLPWDPATLVPPSTAIALRSQTFQVSELSYGAGPIKWAPYPPVITRQAPNVAEGLAAGVALQIRHDGWALTYAFAWQANGPAAMPIAYHGATGSQQQDPLPGAHPVLAHTICAGSAELQTFYVMQAVTSTDSLLAGDVEEYVQRFRLPTTTELRWVEIAVAIQPNAVAWTPGTISICDAQGQSSPPSSPGTALAQSDFWEKAGEAYGAWVAPVDLASFPTLLANHDYWLRVRVAGSHRLYAHRRTGAEGPAFSSAIGETYRRAVPGGPFESLPGAALDFKIIGVGDPHWAVDVPDGAPGRGLHLAASPNPAARATMLAWSGATGRVRLEVLDVRGRRVASREAETSESGSWMWRASGDDGQPLPAGVYFVRAWDAGGSEARARVVLTR